MLTSHHCKETICYEIIFIQGRPVVFSKYEYKEKGYIIKVKTQPCLRINRLHVSAIYVVW